MGLGSIVRSRAWKDEVAFFEEFVRTSPRYATSWNNLGNTCADQGRPGEPTAADKEAVRVGPPYADRSCNLGAAYSLLHRWQESLLAAGELEILRRLDPGLVASPLGIAR